MENLSSRATTARQIYWRFAVCLSLGIVSLFFVGGVGSFAMFEITATLVVIFWILGSALIAGGLSIIQPDVRLVWNIGYSLPIFLWGAGFLLMCLNDIAAFWFTLSLLPLLFGIIGSRIGRRLVQSRLSNNKTASLPVDY